MPLTDHDIERRLQRNEGDIVELYGICRDIQRVVRAHDRRFDAIDDRLDGIDNRLDSIDNRLNSIDTTLAELLRRSDG